MRGPGKTLIWTEVLGGCLLERINDFTILFFKNV